MAKYLAAFLIEKESIWGSLIPYTNIGQDAEWVKLVVHSVPILPFKGDEGESLIRSEIETFNPGLILMRSPIWLSNEENRAKKLHGSILIHLPNQELAKQIASQKRIILAGSYCRVSSYIPKHTQCSRCQKYGHTRAYCKGEVKCRVCALGYKGKDYTCLTCQVADQACPHFIAKCANCGLNHPANSKKCVQ
jgi:hypothetical protein